MVTREEWLAAEERAEAIIEAIAARIAAYQQQDRRLAGPSALLVLMDIKECWAHDRRRREEP